MKLKYLVVFGLVFLVMFSSLNFIFAKQAMLGQEEDDEGGSMISTQAQVRVEQRVDNKSRIRVGNYSANCDCQLSEEQDQIQNRSRVYAQLSNGNKAEVKIMPNVASETALERLRIRVCTEENNCSLELKEVGVGNQTKAMYEVQVERHARILGIFETKMQVRAQVDAETGDVIVKKPWWAWLATEPTEDVEDQETSE